MQDNIITWNFPNWVTITLMALIGFLALGAAMAALKKRSGSLDNSAQTAQ